MEPVLDHAILSAVRPFWDRIEGLVQENSQRVLQAFLRQGLAASDLRGSAGYGYDDRGRVLLDRIYAEIFGAEAAMVRAQWVSGTHALATVLRSLLFPNDEVWVVSGPVYDTLETLLSDDSHPSSLRRRGIRVLFSPSPGTWPPSRHTPRMVYIQRSRGYQPRPSWGKVEMLPLIESAHRQGAIVVVDNCYGEFTDTEEPTHWGADLVVGSLLKNPGGGLANTGAYIAGRAELIAQVADGFIAPGQGREVGPTGEYLRWQAQGFFLAPMMVGEALMGGSYVRSLFLREGFTVQPGLEETAHDIISAIRLESRVRVERFCAAIQQSSPIDSRAEPEAWEMPGYADPVIMAAGGFVPGASLELSSDAPIRPPYWVYLQGGLNRWHTIVAGHRALDAIMSI